VKGYATVISYTASNPPPEKRRRVSELLLHALCSSVWHGNCCERHVDYVEIHLSQQYIVKMKRLGFRFSLTTKAFKT